MTPELQDKLYQDFPDLFREKDLPMSQTCMCWGIDTGDGWEKIIRTACEELSALEGMEHLRFVQVKEKFGTLRLYVNDYQDAVCAIIDKAERASEITCEVCGKPGKVGGRVWLKCLCEECRLDKKH